MSFLAAASRTIAAPPSACFAALASIRTWPSFMPASFRCVRGPEHPLRVGDRLLVRISRAPVPTPLRVSRVEQDRVIAWRGGVPGVLAAEHVFLFDPAPGGGTLARSEETWSGVATAVGAVERAITREATRVATAQLGGLARWVEAGVS